MTVNVPDNLCGLLVDTASVRPDPANYNQHSAAQVEQIAASLVAFGFDQPILARRNGLIIAGHGRLLAARQVGMTHVPVVYTDLDGVDAARRMIGDNRLAALAEPDTEALAELLRQLQAEDALGGTGYDDAAVDALLKEVGGATPADDPGPQVDRAAELQAKWGTALGQVWALGEHRLVCGDCTDPAVVAAVMQGERARYGLHDPPYGINVVGLSGSDGAGKPYGKGAIGFDGVVKVNTYAPVLGDDKPFDPTPLLHLSEFLVLWGANYYADKLPPMKGWLVWDKKGREDWRDTFSDCELAWTNIKTVTRIFRHVWLGMVQEGEREERVHPTQKPVALYEKIMRELFTQEGVVIDCYAGSSPVLLACERLGRKCRAVELSPAYVAVTLQRWADMTGQMPRLLES